jgi:hypothetical protein
MSEEIGFIEKVNNIYEKLDVMVKGGELFDSNVIKALSILNEQDLSPIVEDIKKGNYLGNRKIDINLALNITDPIKTVLYDKATVTFVDGVEIDILFVFDGNATTISTHGDLLIQLNQHTAFLEKLEHTLISSFAINTSGEIIRIYDIIGSGSNIERIKLNAISGAFKEANPVYFWLQTTSAFETIAMRSGDIISLTNSLPKLKSLANSIDEVLELQLRIPQLIDTYTDNIANSDITIYNKLNELTAIYSNLTTIITIFNDIKVGGTNYINTVGNATYKTKIEILADSIYKTKIEAVIENITAIQNAVSNANTASAQAIIATNKAKEASDKVALIQAITAQANTLSAGQNVQVYYDAISNKFTFSIPQGTKGDKGDPFAINSIGLFSQRSLYDSQLDGFSFLALDVIVDGSVIPHIYFKKSSTAGDWSTGVPFGRGEKGDIGDPGISVTGFQRTSGDGSQGSDDVYTMTLSNENTYTFTVHNGRDSDVSLAIINKNLALKINTADIVNDLLTTDENKPLSATQGKILKDLIQNLSIENIIAPTIITPINNAIDFQGPIISSSFATASNYNGTQDYVECQIARDIEFTDIVASYSGSSNLTSWNPSLSIPLIKIYLRVRHGSQNHLSRWSNIVSVTTINQGINAPTITTPANNATNQLKNVVINSSAFSVFGGLAESHLSSSLQVATDINFTNIIFESLNNTINKTSWTTGNLPVSTTCYARVKYESTTYESAHSPTISFTTKAVFTPTIGVQGSKGFGVAPTDEPFALLGLAEMTGTNTEGHDNYGNYIHTNGSIVCWCPKAYYRVGNASSSRYATYSANALDIVGTDIFTTEAAANAAGYVLPRAFINAGAEKSGFFIDKYMNSKDGTTSSKSVFGGVPISLATTAGYTVSNGMTGCTGILADAVVLAKARGSRWNAVLAFQYAWLAIISVAQGQAATSTTNCAWYDATGTTNFPKGCNNNALSDTNDTTVTYVTAGDTGNANKPKTGATANFAKTTHNGSMNGVADLNGGMYEVSIGVTNIGTTATATTAIATDTIYVLKTSIDHAALTGGWDGANDVWGNTTSLSTKYNAVDSPHPLGSVTGTVYWGNAANAVFPTDASGVSRDICGFIPKNPSASNATGINMLGNDQFYKHNRNNMVPLCCGYWSYAANAGLFDRNFSTNRSNDYYAASFRASAYFA